MKQTPKSDGMVEITTDDPTDKSRILHCDGSDDYACCHRRITVTPEAAARYSEIAVADIPPYTKADYDAEVERLIALRYSHGKEIEVNRERDLKPERYAQYIDYINQCKLAAVENLTPQQDNGTETDTDTL